MRKIYGLFLAIICGIMAVLLCAEVVPPLSIEVQALFLVFLGLSLCANMVLIDEL